MQLLTLRTLKVAALTAVISVGTLISTAQAADKPLTEIYADNNGITLLVSASSDHEVISMNLRVVGPNGYVAEERVESDIFEWFPERRLPDGLYNWEAWVVTVKSGAETIEPIGFGQTTEVASQSNIEISEESYQGSPKSNNNHQVDIPVEHFYRSQDKHVKQVSGQFHIEHGLMKPIEDQSPESLSGAFSSTDSPGLLQRFAGAVLSFLIPSAHAQAGNYSSMTLDSTLLDGPSLQYSTNSDVHWVIRGNADRYRIWDAQTSSEPFYIQSGAAESSIYIRGQNTGQSVSPRVGIGTSTPTDELHILGTTPAIRLESRSQSNNWYINNHNQGRFSINDDVTGIAPFTIEPGASAASLYINSNGYVGIGTNNPQSSLHVEGFNTLQMRDFRWTVDPESAYFRGPSGHGAFQVFDAPNNSLVVRDTGNIGIGINSPNAPLHVRRTDGSAQVLVEESSSSSGDLLTLKANDAVKFRLLTNGGTDSWAFRTTGGGNQFAIASPEATGIAFRLTKTGNATFLGNVTANGVLLTSTREAKTDFAPLDIHEVLDRLSSLEISQWRYKHEEEGTKHYGPIAEEFHEAFGLSDGKSLNMIDTNGIAFAAIKALDQQNKELQAENQHLLQRLERLEKAIDI